MKIRDQIPRKSTELAEAVPTVNKEVLGSISPEHTDNRVLEILVAFSDAAIFTQHLQNRLHHLSADVH